MRSAISRAAGAQSLKRARPRFDQLGAKGHAVHAFHMIGTTRLEDLPPPVLRAAIALGVR